jgi:hypothetical protein
MDGRRFNSDLLVVFTHPLNHLAFGTGHSFWDEVVHIQVRERLKPPHGIELAVTEHCLDLLLG